ncbi:MAG: site-specific DNA-methyltransferase [Thermodesulfovibrionales bacterium]|nr:site-specific DNA-methyltransferase [Thermodesulfovibrionales bacterium]
MPRLDWIGRKAVENHHNQVPFRLLKCDPKLSVGDPDSENLLVEGDNLEALKALLPYYAGQVKCIYIDPPYNTGNENWIYNDNVNSPEIRKWLGEVVGKEDEDLSRHDKWLCMMYPRLLLLKKLLSRDGIIAVSIDDNELNNLGIILDEMFGSRNRLVCAPWLSEPSGGKQKSSLRQGHEYIFIYHNGDISMLTREEKSTGKLDKRDKFGKYRKGRELLKWGEQSLRSDRLKMWFPLYAPDGMEVFPIRNDGQEGRWRLGKENALIKKILEDPEHAHWEMRPYDNGVKLNGESERWVPYEKIRDAKKSFGWNTWLDSYGFNADATRELKNIFGEKPFNTPKPTSLLKWIISLHEDENALILDSFAGSGTTGDAVLQLNKEDGGKRRFILVEIEEDIGQKVTSQRLKQVINGYKDEPPLGGGFKYCKLGSTLFNAEGNIQGDVTYKDLAQHVYFVETGKPLLIDSDYTPPLIGKSENLAVYLLYNGVLNDKKPTGGNVLTRAVLETLPPHNGLKVIYGTSCRIGKDYLKRKGITFKQIPYEIKDY